MKKKFLFIFLFVLLLIPFKISALSNDYKDVVFDIVSKSIESDKVNIYFFHTDGCPHCAKGKVWLNEIKDKYKNKISIYEYEVLNNESNAKYLESVKERFNTNINSYPFIVIGDKFYVGFSDATASKLESKLDNYLEINKDDNFSIPVLGKISAKNVSIPLVGVILGFIDGFNPCAMWVLLFLITMLIGMKNKKRMWVLGISFLVASALIYFLSILGISFVLGVSTVSWLKKMIAIVALAAGFINLKDYFRSRKQNAGCNVVDAKKRKKIFTKVKKITNENNFILAFLGIVALAISVNLIELACSLGFPMIFTEILAINNIHGISRILYLLIYILFYMIDDIIVFIISMIALETTGFTNKYSKFSHLVGGVLMIIMALLLIFKPEWLMFNFS